MSAMLAWLELGGPAMWVLAAMSVLALTLSILKLWEFADQGLDRRTAADAALDACEAGRLDQALERLAAVRSPLSQVLHAAMTLQQQTILSPAKQRERIERLALDALEYARRHLRTLELIAQLAPLVGLLGTVLGMIEAFQALQAAGDRVQPSVLSGGIWQALLTTAVGLGVAVPTLTVHHYLERRVERLQLALESALTRWFTRTAD